MTIQDMAAALAARDAGMDSSAQHAEDVQPGWQDQAIKWLRLWAHVEPFTIEEFRCFILEHSDLDRPPDARAYGSLTVRAIREGIIEKTGQYAPAASSHGSPKPLYRRKGNV